MRTAQHLPPAPNRMNRHSKRCALGAGFTVILTAYLLLGAVKFVPLEEDGMHVAVGIQTQILSGSLAPPSYFASGQAGTHLLIEWIARGFAVPTYDAFCLLTVCAALINGAASILFVRRLTDSSLLASAAAVLLFQEIFVASFYPNSSVVAAAFLSVALLLASDPKSLPRAAAAGICFALAAWCRLDAAALGAAFLVLFLISDAGLNKAGLRPLLTFGLCAGTATMLIFGLRELSLTDVFAALSRKYESDVDLGQTLRVYSTIFTLAVVYFAAYGFYRIAATRSRRVGFLVALGALPLIGAYGLATNSPKYLLYAMTLFAIPAALGIQRMRFEQGRADVYTLAGLLLIAGQYVFTPDLPLLLNRDVIVSTADFNRLRGSIAFTPIWWLKEKQHYARLNDEYDAKIDAYLSQDTDSCMISQSWFSNSQLRYHLQLSGYRMSRLAFYPQYPGDHSRFAFHFRNEAKELLFIGWLPRTPLEFPVEWKREVERCPSVLYVAGDYPPWGELLGSYPGSFLAKSFDHRHWMDERFNTLELVNAKSAKPAGF
jgi:hypothetical protein